MGFMPIVSFRVVRGGEEMAPFLTAVREEMLPLRQFGGEGLMLSGEIPARYYPELARVARENGVVLRHTSKRGQYYFFRRYRKRLGVLTGTALFCAALGFSQCFLWAIDIVPTQMVSEQQVLDVLESHGIRIGTFLPTAKLEQTAAYARTELPGLAFFALNRIGSRLEVAMADAVQPPVHLKEDGICNIVARKNGIVRSVEDYAGQQTVTPSQSVAEGQLLISGIFENRDGNILYVHAEGKVMAETQETRTFTMPLVYTEREYTGETGERWRVDLFGKKWPLFLAVAPELPYESHTELQQAKLGPLLLPFGVEREEMRFYREKEVHLTEEQALERLQKMADEYGAELAERVKVLGQEQQASVSDGVMQMEVVWTVLEDIAAEQPVEDGMAADHSP